jgi:2-C-methyl-D-erythritol 2,4-cyclodiphosphate synthase
MNDSKMTRVGLGKSMHRFMPSDCNKPCVLGGIFIEGAPGFLSETDGDVVIESLCFAIESISSFKLYETIEHYVTKEGITDSTFFLKQALQYLKGSAIANLAFVIEGKSPWLSNQQKLIIQEKLASLCSIPFFTIGISQISCDGLNDCGLGIGLSATANITIKPVE